MMKPESIGCIIVFMKILGLLSSGFMTLRKSCRVKDLSPTQDFHFFLFCFIFLIILRYEYINRLYLLFFLYSFLFSLGCFLLVLLLFLHFSEF